LCEEGERCIKGKCELVEPETSEDLYIEIVERTPNFEFEPFKEKEVNSTEIKRLIEEKSALWNAKETSISRMSIDEKKKLLGLIPTKEEIKKIKEASTSYSVTKIRSDLPAFFDWRDQHSYNYITEVRDQSSCGSCWAFGAIATLEGHVNAYYNNPNLDLDLSEQDLVSCFHGTGCSGAYTEQIEEIFSDYFQNIGVAKETCFPYTATNNNCSNKCSDWQVDAWKTLGYQSIDLNGSLDERINNLKQALLDYGPIEVGMQVFEDFPDYGGGIYSHTVEWILGYHAVTIVGFGKYDGMNYWIVKNSWGENWGEQGYFRIAAGDSGIDSWFAFAVTQPNPPTQQNKNCVDEDLDGYCFWGLGEKPATCPLCDEIIKDCDDSDDTIFENCGNLNEALGILIADSEPSKAKVFVKEQNSENYIYRGETHAEFNLNSGLRTIKLTKETYEDLILEVEITEGEEKKINPYLLLAPRLIHPEERDIFKLGSVLEIIGTIPSHVDNYIVEFEEESNPGVWNLIYQDSGTIIEDVIAEFDTSIVSGEGKINIRLTANKIDGNISEDFIYNIYLDPMIKEGWPFVFGNYIGENEGQSYNPIIEDLDNDGEKEIIFKGSHHIWVLNKDGTLFNNGWPQKKGCYNGSSGFVYPPSVGDIDGDGEKEILIEAHGWWGVTDDEGISCEPCAYAWEIDGSPVEGWPINCTDYTQDEIVVISSSFVLSDLDNDGAMEAIGNYRGAYDTYYPATLVFQGDGTKFGNWPFTFEPFDEFTPVRLEGTPAVGDVDCDGEKEIVVIVEGDDLVGRTRYIYILSPDATIKNKFWTGSYMGTQAHNVVLTDIDQDCDLEIIFKKNSYDLQIVHHDGSEYQENWSLYNTDYPDYLANQISVGKVNQDDFGVVIGDYPSGEWVEKGNLILLNENGEVIWKKPTKGYLVSQASVVDIDGDFLSEVFSTSLNKMLYGFDYYGNSLNGFPKNLSTWTTSGTSLDDLEGNGLVDLITSDFERMYVWEIQNSQTPILHWPQFHHDSQHTGLYTDFCADLDQDGFSTCDNDCDDSNPNINPSTEEVCDNGLDDNCNNLIDTSDLSACTCEGNSGMCKTYSSNNPCASDGGHYMQYSEPAIGIEFFCPGGLQCCLLPENTTPR